MFLIKRKITGSDTKKANCVNSNQALWNIAPVLSSPTPHVAQSLRLNLFSILIIGMKRGKQDMLYNISVSSWWRLISSSRWTEPFVFYSGFHSCPVVLLCYSDKLQTKLLLIYFYRVRLEKHPNLLLFQQYIPTNEKKITQME